ncbi:MAG: hypothetical protein KGH58_01420 [Candidatus Micrarchaeota archaeon]|nr:hypothetical protein [Candidatus Micrarchaeota archaeon]
MTTSRVHGGIARFALTTAVMALVIAVSLGSLASGIASAQGTQQPNGAKTAVLNWLPVATLGVLAIIAVAAMVFALSGIINSPNARNWARMQVYEGLLSVVMILVFASFSYLFTLSPQNALQSMHMVPATCTGASTIQTLGTCDMALFNSAAYELYNYAYGISFLVGVVSPDLRATVNPIPNQPSTLSATFRVKTIAPWSLSGLFGKGLSALLFMILLSQVQLILLSSSTFFFTFFMSLGLITRTFGFTRSFGGSMIALGMGLGIIYPLIVSITFGFIDTSTTIPSIQCLASSTPACAISSTASTLWSIILSVPSLLLQGPGADPLTGVSSLLLSLGYFAAGFTFIPFLNFVILDAFIIDFSSAVGERMDFMSLLTSLV